MITALCVSRDGSLWIASESNGVTRVEGGVFTHFCRRMVCRQPDPMPVGESGWQSVDRGESGLAVSGRPFHALSRAGNAAQQLRSRRSRGRARNSWGRHSDGIGKSEFGGRSAPDNFLVWGRWRGFFKAVCGPAGAPVVGQFTYGLICFTDGKRGSYAANKSFSERITTVLHEDREPVVDRDLRRAQPSVDGVLAPWWWTRRIRRAWTIWSIMVFEDREQNLWVGRDGLIG